MHHDYAETWVARGVRGGVWRRYIGTDTAILEPRVWLDDMMPKRGAGWTEDEAYRCMMSGIPRAVMSMDREMKIAMLHREPDWTLPVWDCLAAALCEHLCWLHAIETPAWATGDGRYLRRTYFFTRDYSTRVEWIIRIPPAFEIHGVIPDPSDLDERGGERRQW